MTKDDDERIQRFQGRTTDDYNLWRLRAEIALKGKGYWRKLNKDECPDDIKDKATALLTASLGDAPFRVCSAKYNDPMAMLSLLDKRYASDRAATRISTLTTVYSKRLSSNDNMTTYIDEFESLFSQLYRMGSDVSIPDTHKGPLLLASMGQQSPLEPTVAALRLKEVDELTWDAVTADLIQEWKRIKESGSCSKREKHDRHKTEKLKFRSLRASHSMKNARCSFCSKTGHTSVTCHYNPESAKCIVSPDAIRNIKGLNVTDSVKEKSSEKQKKHRITFGGTSVIENKFTAATSSKKDTAQNDSTQILDSGASITLFRDRYELNDDSYKRGSQNTVTLAVGDREAHCIGEGTLHCGRITLPNAQHVHGLNNTFISVGQLCDQGNIVIFTSEEAIVLNRRKLTVYESDIMSIASRDKNNGLYTMLSADDRQAYAISAITKKDSLSLWHRRLVHANERILRQLSINANGVPEMHGELEFCHPCRLGRATKRAFKSQFKRANHAGEIVHSDLVGPLPKSHCGQKYFVTFTDQYTRYTHVIALNSKGETADAFRMYSKSSHVLKYFPNGIERFHTDGGTEYSCIESTEHTTTTPHTPQHNPFSERINRTLLDPTRIILEESGMDASCWEWALDHVAYVKNHLPHSSIGCSPFEKLTNSSPALHHLRVFGCSAFVYNHEPKSKLHSTAEPAVLLGCDNNGVYTVQLLKSGKIVNSVHVTFDEMTFLALDNIESSEDEGDTGSYSSPSDTDNGNVLFCSF